MGNIESFQHLRYERIQETAAQFLSLESKQILAKIFQDKATGVKAKGRQYRNIVAIKAQTKNGRIFQLPIESLIALQAKIVTKDPSITRVLYTVQEKTPKQPYVLTIRAVQTRDFLTARVA